MSETKSTRDHDTIRRWAEERNASPAAVASTRDTDDAGLLRFDFAGYESEDLQKISWDEFFSKFDEKQLQLLYQETTNSGEKSNFFKLVSS